MIIIQLGEALLPSRVITSVLATDIGIDKISAAWGSAMLRECFPNNSSGKATKLSSPGVKEKENKKQIATPLGPVGGGFVGWDARHLPFCSKACAKSKTCLPG